MTHRRSTTRSWLLLAGCLAVMAFATYAERQSTSIPTVGGPPVEIGFGASHGLELLVILAVSGVVALGSVLQLVRARHAVSVEADGITDRSVFPERVSWTSIDDVTLIGSEKSGYSIALARSEAAGGRQLLVDLATIADAPSAVFQDVFDHWRAARAPATTT